MMSKHGAIGLDHLQEHKFFLLIHFALQTLCSSTMKFSAPRHNTKYLQAVCIKQRHNSHKTSASLSLEQPQTPQTQCIGKICGYWGVSPATQQRKGKRSVWSHCNPNFSVKYEGQIPFGQKSGPRTFNILLMISPCLQCLQKFFSPQT